MSDYDRSLLLGPKRNDVLELWEVERYGRDSFGDEDYVSVYGLRPREWYERGVRMLGRTVVECTRDRLADLISRDLAGVAARASAAAVVAIDPFAGSCNTLHWIGRSVGARTAIGYEVDDAVATLTRRNIALLDLPVTLLHQPYEPGSHHDGDVVVAFVAPPWGDALGADGVLDLRQTRPPIAEVIDTIEGRRLLFGVQLYEHVEPGSLREIEARCDWSAVKTYDIDEPGRNHGLLVGTVGWTP